MININEEENREISAQDCYDILVYATNETLVECGFLNSFLFSHIVYVLAVKLLMEDIELDPADGWLNLWEACIKNDFLKEALDSYPEDFAYLATEADIWQKEYTAYANSGRSAMDGLAMVIQDTVGGIREIVESQDVQSLLATAKKFGIDNSAKEHNSLDLATS